MKKTLRMWPYAKGVKRERRGGRRDIGHDYREREAETERGTKGRLKR
jgi:hypothetical protein